MKIALTTPISLRCFGGAERKLVEAAEMLAEGGHEVNIYALPYAHPGTKVDRAFVTSSLKRLNINYYEKKHHKITADVAYVIYVPLTWRRFKLSCPIIAGLHSPLLFPSKSSMIIFANPSLTFQRYGSLRYMATFWFSNFMKTVDLARFNAVRILNPSFRVKHRKVYCIPDWINSKVFKPSSEKSDTFTVLFSGRHHWEKGFDIFLKVAETLTEKGFKMRFICTRGGAGLVKGTGFLNNNKLAETYSRSHLVIYPSRMDTFGGVILEAAACGTPVITTPLPAHLLNLPLFYANNTEEFVRLTIRIYSLWRQRKNIYDDLTQKCSEQASRYDIEKIFLKFEAMLKQVAEL